jgi:hypothetical protein
MKKIVSVLAESPLYFTMSLRDRYELVKRLQGNGDRIDLTRYQLMVSEFLKIEEQYLPRSFWRNYPR